MTALTKDAASSRGDQFALVDDEGSVSWALLDERVNRLVAALRNAGLAPGDTLGLLAGNQREWFETVLACTASGIIFVPINWHLVAPELACIMADSGAKALVVDERYIDVAVDALSDDRTAGVSLAIAIGNRGGHDLVPYEDLLASGSGAEPGHPVFGGPMFYTSGTTGNPKGVRSALSTMGVDVGPEIWQLIGAGFSQPLPHHGVTVLCGPAYHSAQWAYSFLPLIAGSSIVMQHTFDGAHMLELIDRYQGTNIHLVPTQMKRLVAACPATRSLARSNTATNCHELAPASSRSASCEIPTGRDTSVRSDRSPGRSDEGLCVSRSAPP